MKNTINEMKNIREGINSGLNDSEENVIVYVLFKAGFTLILIF